MVRLILRRMAAKWERNDALRLKDKKYPESVVEIRDVPYTGSNERGHLLDICYPKAVGGKLPVLIDIHGGGFISGCKELDRLFANHMAARGFLVFNVNYRLAERSVTVFDQIHDIDRAVSWITENLDSYNGDADSMYICGHSAGGVLAVVEALLCRSHELRRAYGIKARKHDYRGVILDCAMMWFYRPEFAFRGMRTVLFPRGYKKDERYRRIVFESSEDTALLPRCYLMTNGEDEIRDMT